MNLAILNYGMANLRSVQKCFESVGHRAELITTADEIATCDRLVLPGVGAVGDALGHIRNCGLEQPILEHIRKGKPFLGICLGMQMLMETCLEGGTHRGMGVIPGDCIRFDVDDAFGLKVPHMGWNQLKIECRAPIFENVADGANVYFVHGYHVRLTDQSWIATTTDYGRPFVSSIWRDNVMATQFHPEKSQRVGQSILKAFAAL
ncbi:MAG: imidazole glycerol phosphate synthase subunit HisH [Tepidisphaeraceae bacterium]